jgi:hypothetical protein
MNPKDLPVTAQMHLHWTQPETFQRHFLLGTEGAPLGSLRFASAFGSLADAQWGESRWTFKRVGFLNPRITVREAGQDSNLAVFTPKFWGDGWCEFAGGGRFHWKAANFWGTSYGFLDDQERPLFKVSPGIEGETLRGFFKSQATVVLAPHPQRLAELPVLVLLGWYLMILHREDAATTAATTAAAG